MQPLRRRINPQNFVITLRQIAKHLKTNPERILNWEKWEHVLWVHLEGRGGYFISYRKLQQWIAACRTLIQGCRNLKTLDVLSSAITQEAERYTEDAFAQLEAIWQQRHTYLSTHQRY
jgi:3-methyladenine DNA glycosylase AlkD